MYFLKFEFFLFEYIYFLKKEIYFFERKNFSNKKDKFFIFLEHEHVLPPFFADFKQKREYFVCSLYI